jgi:hypothetical protein
MAFVNGGAVVSCGNVLIPTAGSMLLGSSAGASGTAQLGPVNLVGNLIKPVIIKTARAVSSTRIRVEFSRAVLSNSALADPSNYAVKAVNTGADIAITGIDVPNGTQVNTVDILVSEMTQWDGTSAATYLLSINSSSIALGPQLVNDWNMELAGVANWPAYLGATLAKVAGSPSGTGTQVLEVQGGTTLAGAKQLGTFIVGAYYRVSAWWKNSLLTAAPAIGFGSPTLLSQCFLQGNSGQTSFGFHSIDIAATALDLFVGRDGGGSASRAQFDDVSVQRWTPAGGGSIEIADSEGISVAPDPFGFTGLGTAPTVVVAYATDKNTIVVQFSESILDLGSIRTVGAYTANLGLTISAVLSVDVDSVTLKTSNQTPGQLYTLTLTGTWYDKALNALASPTNTPVLGFVTPAAIPALLRLSMYNFLIQGIRDADQTDAGARFIERFFMGPQTIWTQTIQTIFDIPKIWSASDCPDELLQYLKRIVGWTVETDTITEALDFATLRRLIAASVRFWKTRGPESSIEDLLLLTTAARSYIQNWFTLRFIADEVFLGEEHGEGTDPWLLSTPGEGDPDAWTYNIRIVDDGSLNHQLVRDIAKLTRPTGERVLITYLGFLDRFETDGDLTQWSFPVSTGMTHIVSGGKLRMETSNSSQRYGWVDVSGNQNWSSYVVSWTFKTNMNQCEFIFYGVGDPSVADLADYYYALLNTDADATTPNRIRIAKRVAGAATTLADVTLYPGTFNERICIDTTYTLRVEVCPANAGSSLNSISVYLDGELVASLTTDGTFSQGALGIRPRSDLAGTKYFDLLELEMFFLPRSFDFIDLGNVTNNAEVLRGPEIMVDTGFDDPTKWNCDTALSVAGGFGVAAPGGANGRKIYQLGVTFKAGEKYNVRFTVSNYVAGTVLFRLTTPGAAVDSDTSAVSANGTYDLTITVLLDSVGSTSLAGFRFDAISNLKVDNVSLTKILYPTG